MNKNCSTCKKVVYPLEQFKCLDQVWHKACFKCQTCNMTLNVKNYKGYEKKPYCQSHYPQPSKFTVIADTPEMQRVASNSKVISNVKYHENFERNKGAKISVTDDPVSRQQKQTMQTISQVSYHGVLDKKSAMEARRGSVDDSTDHIQVQRTADPGTAVEQVTYRRAPPGSILDYEPGKGMPEVRSQRPVSTTFFAAATPAPSQTQNDSHHGSYHEKPPNGSSFNGMAAVATANGAGRQATSGKPNIETPKLVSGDSPVHTSNVIVTSRNLNGLSQEKDKGLCFRALFDYTAQEGDEVSFLEGDSIVRGDPIDEGWMFGTVERTGQFGMLPSNYLEPLD